MDSTQTAQTATPRRETFSTLGDALRSLGDVNVIGCGHFAEFEIFGISADYQAEVEDAIEYERHPGTAIVDRELGLIMWQHAASGRTRLAYRVVECDDQGLVIRKPA